ncbi:MAG: Uma2 family endonuclease [Lachnospiraceae bacterium]|nr:Uma2 family endonuclease [Lachnospiraceae bacterium]
MDIKQELDYYTAEDFYALTGDRGGVELINGQLYYLWDMAAPSRGHQKILMALSYRIQDYIYKTGGSCEIYPAPFDVQLSEKSDDIVEPDITVICDPEKLTDRGCTGAPDWIIEIVSPSNPSHDYLTKLGLYRKAGVREYWIVDPMGKRISVYNGDYTIPGEYSFEDKIKVGIYEDLEIDFKEIATRL